MSTIDKNKVFAIMSGNFLAEQLPYDWADWDDDTLQQFFEDNVWQPFEDWGWRDVYDLIVMCTHDVMKLLEEKNDA